MTVYVDTSAWIALFDRRESRHATARATLSEALPKGLTTGWHTLVELADGLAHHYDQETAAREIDRLRSSPRLRILDSEPARDAALDIFRARPSWGVDLSDCLSFALMQKHGISTAFTYDTDFEKAGFRRIG